VTYPQLAHVAEHHRRAALSNSAAFAPPLVPTQPNCSRRFKPPDALEDLERSRSAKNAPEQHHHRTLANHYMFMIVSEPEAAANEKTVAVAANAGRPLKPPKSLMAYHLPTCLVFRQHNEIHLVAPGLKFCRRYLPHHPAGAMARNVHWISAETKTPTEAGAEASDAYGSAPYFFPALRYHALVTYKAGPALGSIRGPKTAAWHVTRARGPGFAGANVGRGLSCAPASAAPPASWRARRSARLRLARCCSRVSAGSRTWLHRQTID
jgi:hypothetical protein